MSIGLINELNRLLGQSEATLIVLSMLLDENVTEEPSKDVVQNLIDSVLTHLKAISNLSSVIRE